MIPYLLIINYINLDFGRRNTDRRSRMISAPSNFNHISHMVSTLSIFSCFNIIMLKFIFYFQGPGDGIQIQRLMDLPTTLETADSTPVTPQQQQGV